MGALTDVTATVRLRERADRDPLTGLPNRRAIEEQLAVAVLERPERTVVVFVDLDGFKAVNDAHGHEVGDAVLVSLAERLQASVRPDDTVGRYGGDEFVLIIRGVDPGDEAIAERLDRALADPVDWDGGCWQPEISIGIARPAPGEDPAAVLRHADHEMFASKRLRKLRVVSG